MCWAKALVWLCAAGLLRAEVPMDLDSPFVHTVLIQEKTGEITEKAVRKGQIKEGLIEFEKEEGGLLILPRKQARCERIREKGGEPFRDLQLPEAVLKFRQGVGRLIRSREDRGQIAVLDGRILTKSYGKAFLQMLPECEVRILEVEE